MKKTITLLFIALAAFALVGCDGTMHNTQSSNVTFVFKDMPMANGTYDVRGNFFVDAWSASDKRQVTITGGNGSYTTASMMITGSLEFTLCDLGGAWSRPWMTGILGNSGGLPPNSNFLVTIPMDGGSHVITVDAADANADGVADLYVDGVLQ